VLAGRSCRRPDRGQLGQGLGVLAKVLDHQPEAGPVGLAQRDGGGQQRQVDLVAEQVVAGGAATDRPRPDSGEQDAGVKGVLVADLDEQVEGGQQSVQVDQRRAGGG
jgi:hypothetical protein